MGLLFRVIPITKDTRLLLKERGYFISPTGAGQNIAIAALKDAGGIIGVTITNKHSRGHGLWIESANPKSSQQHPDS